MRGSRQNPLGWEVPGTRCAQTLPELSHGGAPARPLQEARRPLKESREGRGWRCRDRRPCRCRQQNRRAAGPRGLEHLEREPGRVNATRQVSHGHS